ncbi:MAG: helix-turn-helix transcriptional regulator [Gemmatimonadales bacterium]|nr:helix-turn-helix transcriptional regulator [Gemmatimonadales bacterium]
MTDRDSGACGCAEASAARSASCCCGQATLLHAIGRRYTMPVLNRIGNRSPVRFRELQRSLRLSSSTLAETLDDLSAAGLIIREVVPDRPPHAEYRLTAAGKALVDRFRPMLDRIRAAMS